MTNPYLDLLQTQPAAPGTAPPANPYLAALQADEDQRRQAVAGQLTQAVGVNPDQYNAKRRVAQYLGYPTAAVEALPHLENQAKVQQVQQAAAGSPALQRRYTDADFAKLAHDDAPVLAKIETAVAGAVRTLMGADNRGPSRTPADIVGDAGVVAAKGAVGLPQALVGLADIVTGGYAGKAAEAVGVRFKDAQQFLDTLYSDPQQRANAAVKEADGFVGTLGAMLTNPSTIATAVGESAPQMLGGAAIGRGLLAVAPRVAPWLAAALGEGLLGAGTAAEQSRQDNDGGLLTARQTFAAMGSGAGTALFGALGGRVAQRLGLDDIDTALVARGLTADSASAAKSGFVSAVAKSGLSEGVFEELPQSIQEQMWQNWGNGRPLSEGVGAAAAQGLLAGMAAGGGFQAVGRVAERFGALDREAADAVQREEQLKEAIAQAAQSKLADRSPEQLQAFVAEASGDATVRFDADVLMQVFNQDVQALAQALPSVDVQALQEMAATGGEVSVPMGELVAGTRGTGVEQTILEHARLGDSALSAAEAREVQGTLAQSLQQETERVIAQAQDQAAARASHDAVRDSIKAQVVATGRVRDAVAEGYATFAASFFTAYGSRMGMTAEQFYAAYPLRVLGAPSAGQQGAAPLEQGGVPVDVTPGGGSKTLKVGATTIDYGVARDGRRMEVILIKTPKAERGQGQARAALTQLLDVADANGMEVVLTAEPMDKSTSKAKLEKFYKSLGFAPNSGKAKDFTTRAGMIRPAKSGTLAQGQSAPRGTFDTQTLDLVLNPNANLSTWFHEVGHFWLEVLADVAGQPNAPAQIVEDMGTFLKWAGVQDLATWNAMTLDQQRPYHERWAEGVEQYVMEGRAPSVELQPLMRRFATWLKSVYGSVKEFVASRGQVSGQGTGGGNNLEQRGLVATVRDDGVLSSSGDGAGVVASADGASASEVAARIAAAETGKPLTVRVQHGTAGPEFEAFRPRTARAVWFAEAAGYAQKYADSRQGGNRRVISADVMLNNPLVIDMKGVADPDVSKAKGALRYANTIEDIAGVAQQWGHDGVVFKNRKATDEGFSSNEIAVFDAAAIRVAGTTRSTGGAREGVLTDDSGQPLVLYHGSPTRKAGRKFDAAKSGQRTDQGNMGSGVYLTPAESVARAYANNTGDVEGFYVTGGKVLTFVYDENYKANIEALAKQIGVDAAAEWGRVGQTNPDWSKQFSEKARAAGYVATGGVNVDGTFAEMVVYDPANLRPVSGRPLSQDPSAPAGPDLQLNDDIRRVMDRMLATDEQIAQANEVAGLVPDEAADAEAQERLRKRSIADLKWSVKARDKALSALRKSAKGIEAGIREQVVAEVEQMPEVRAAAALKEGTAPEVVADSFGYPSTDAMTKAIDAFGKKSDVVDGMTKQRMLEEHGDLVDERAIKDAANEAVHNEARARSLATELRTQSEMLNTRTDTGQTNAKGSRVTVNALVEAAKQFGANIVGRTPLRDLKAKAWQHTQSERRAAKRWAEATAAGKTADAVKAKQDQMLNHAAARALLDAQDESRKVIDFFKRVAKGNDEETVKKGRDADIVNAARAVLAAYGLETSTTKRAADYLEAVKANDADTYAVIAPMVEDATRNAQPLEALTFDELQGLSEHVHALWHLAKRSRQMEVGGKLVDRQELADQLYARMEDIGIPDTVPGEGKAVTKAEERALFLRQGVSFLRRVEQWAEGMDGKYGGPFLRFVFQPVKDAADRYRTERTAYRKKLQALVDGIAPIVGDQVIAAPELGYTFGAPGSTRGTAMNEVLHAIIHTGNASNMRKLLLGRQWATENADGTLDTTKWDAFIGRLIGEGKLQQAHYDFVQGVWDLLEETKPLAQKAHRDAFGRYFAEVTADAFVDPFGVPRRGGYAPAVVDSEVVKDNELRKLAEAENESMAFAFPQPNKGFTQSRVEYNRPLLLDLRTLGQHLDKVLLFSHMTQPARDVRRLLTDKKVGQPLTRMDPSAVSSMLQPWLQRSAQQVVEDPIVGAGKWARVPGVIRLRAGMALMFANVSNSIQQVTGLVMAGVKVKPSYVMRALAQHVAHPAKMSSAVWDASPYMNDRASNEVAVLNEQMRDILINPSVYEKAQAWSMKHAYFLQTAVDNALSPIVWTGAYNQAMAEGMTHEDAVKFADGTVRQTQGSTLPEDVSRFETGPAYARAFTQFVGYFNMVANTNATALQQIASEVGLKRGAGRAFRVVMLGLLAPIWVAEAIAQAFKGGPDDEDKDGYLDDWLAAVFGFGTIKGLLAMVPVAGQAANSAVTRLDSNPMNDRISLSPGLSLLESALGGNVQTVYELLNPDKEVNARRAVRDAATLVSVFTGLPLYAVARPLGYLAGMADDRIEPTGPVDAARGMVTGVPSPASKTR